MKAQEVEARDQEIVMRDMNAANIHAEIIHLGEIDEGVIG